MVSNVLNIRLPEEVKNRLEALSRSTGRPIAYHVREAVEWHLDELEWAYDVAARAEAIRAGVRGSRPLDDVARDLGFDPAKLRSEATAEQRD